VAPDADAFVRFVVAYETGPAPTGEFAPKAMRAEPGPHGARFSMPEGRASVSAAGAAEVRMLHGLEQREFYTLVNLVRACLAWMMPGRGGMLLHAAGLVLDGRAFVLVGGAGAGKSTWAGLGERAGGRVLSDDLVLLDGAGDGLEALGSPFRSTHRAEYRPGRWPLAGVLFPRHAADAALRPATRLETITRITANLPFLTEGVVGDERVSSLLDRVAATVPCRELTFGLDPSFVDLLRSIRAGE
jgi:hypothetical protein